MSERARVSVTELRQNLRMYLRRTLAGETLELTDRGRPVALLTPLPEHAAPIARLAAEGRLKPATRRVEDLGPPLEVELERPLSDVLEEMREDRI
jgi:prevent-host-death family protein